MFGTNKEAAIELVKALNWLLVAIRRDRDRLRFCPTRVDKDYMRTGTYSLAVELHNRCARNLGLRIELPPGLYFQNQGPEDSGDLIKDLVITLTTLCFDIAGQPDALRDPITGGPYIYTEEFSKAVEICNRHVKPYRAHLTLNFSFISSIK